MREIKFRCWDKVQGKMFEPSSLSWKNGSMWVCDVHGENKLEYEMVHPNAELMQYTGLKDKQGKEIYEGDIVKFYYSADTGIDGKGATTMIDTVEFEDGSFYFMNCDTGGGAYANRYNEYSQVIGNIYENPELLN